MTPESLSLHPPLAGVRAYHQRHAAAIIEELVSFASLPNNVNRPAEIQRNAAALRAMMERRGIEVTLLETPTGRPVVFGELAAPDPSAPTLLFYGHYDGVPVEGAQWHSDPYQPVLRAGYPSGPTPDWGTLPLPEDGRFDPEWRLFARSIADSKNAIVALLSSLDALRAQGLAPQVNLKFFFDGEEEQESPSLAACIATHRERLAADLMISASGELHQSGLPTVAFGVRGQLMFALTAYTAALELHSGHFGNFAPSAVFRLVALLASMKNQAGEVTIEGFYDEVWPLSESEQAAIRAIPQIEAQIQEQFAIHQPERAGMLLQELINLPTLNVRGLQAGFVGEEARNIIPRRATADFDIRLVKGMDPANTLACIVAHIEKQGWTVLDHAPSEAELRTHARVIHLQPHAAFPATRTPLDSPLAGQIVRAMQRAVEGPIVVEPTEGGSLPLYLFEEIGIPFVSIPTSNFDCNQHTSDENLRLGNLFQGIDIFASVMLWD